MNKKKFFYILLSAATVFLTTTVSAAEVRIKKINNAGQYSQTEEDLNDTDSEGTESQTQVNEYVYPESNTNEVLYTPEYYEPYNTGGSYNTGIYYHGDYRHNNRYYNHHDHHEDHHNPNHSGHREGHQSSGHRTGGHSSGGHHR